MLSYQHGYHAGNFADVVKHLTLSRLLSYMTHKEKPIFYLETHSGRGSYDLKEGQAVKTKEHQQGIELLWKQKETLPAPFNPYLQILRRMNPANELRYYPGSPSLALHLLREQDRLFCSELHPREFEHLQRLPSDGKRVFFSHSDGVENLKSLLPPPERRGLIFIDPSYEIKTDYKSMPKAIKAAYQQFSTGVFCLWYPIVDKYFHEQLLRGLDNIDVANPLRLEFNLSHLAGPGMTGCGLWMANAPYVLKEEMKIILQELRSLFNPGSSSFSIV